MWSRRLKESFAIITLGDGIIELLAPRRHSELWETGPGFARRAARFFADHPGYMRALGAAQVGFGLWLAFRQYQNQR